MSISASALARIAGSPTAAAPAVPLRLSFAASGTYQLTGLLQEDDPLAGAAGARGAEAVRVACAAAEGGAGDQAALEAAGGGNDALAAALAARLDESGPARIAEVGQLLGCLAVGCSWMLGLMSSELRQLTHQPHRACFPNATGSCLPSACARPPPPPLAPPRCCWAASSCPAAACC
jgi:hypothetical protein